MGTNVEDMLGKYSVKEMVWDPLNLASKYDVNWLREAEVIATERESCALLPSVQSPAACSVW